MSLGQRRLGAQGSVAVCSCAVPVLHPARFSGRREGAWAVVISTKLGQGRGEGRGGEKGATATGEL
jgi:hypothetical protein